MEEKPKIGTKWRKNIPLKPESNTYKKKQQSKYTPVTKEVVTEREIMEIIDDNSFSYGHIIHQTKGYVNQNLTNPHFISILLKILQKFEEKTIYCGELLGLLISEVRVKEIWEGQMEKTTRESLWKLIFSNLRIILPPEICLSTELKEENQRDIEITAKIGNEIIQHLRFYSFLCYKCLHNNTCETELFGILFTLAQMKQKKISHHALLCLSNVVIKFPPILIPHIPNILDLIIRKIVKYGDSLDPQNAPPTDYKFLTLLTRIASNSLGGAKNHGEYIKHPNTLFNKLYELLFINTEFEGMKLSNVGGSERETQWESEGEKSGISSSDSEDFSVGEVASRLKMSILHCIQNLSKCTPTVFSGFWQVIFPSFVFTPTSSKSLDLSKLNCMLEKHREPSLIYLVDRSDGELGICIWNTIISIVDNPVVLKYKGYLEVASKPHLKRQKATPGAFVSLAYKIGSILRHLHYFLLLYIYKETDPLTLSQLFKALSTLILFSPYPTMLPGLLTECVNLAIIPRIFPTNTLHTLSSMSILALGTAFGRVETKEELFTNILTKYNVIHRLLGGTSMQTHILYYSEILHLLLKLAKTQCPYVLANWETVTAFLQTIFNYSDTKLQLNGVKLIEEIVKSSNYAIYQYSSQEEDDLVIPVPGIPTQNTKLEEVKHSIELEKGSEEEKSVEGVGEIRNKDLGEIRNKDLGEIRNKDLGEIRNKDLGESGKSGNSDLVESIMESSEFINLILWLFNRYKASATTWSPPISTEFSISVMNMLGSLSNPQWRLISPKTRDEVLDFIFLQGESPQLKAGSLKTLGTLITHPIFFRDSEFVGATLDRVILQAEENNLAVAIRNSWTLANTVFWADIIPCHIPIYKLILVAYKYAAHIKDKVCASGIRAIGYLFNRGGDLYKLDPECNIDLENIQRVIVSQLSHKLPKVVWNACVAISYMTQNPSLTGDEYIYTQESLDMLLQIIMNNTNYKTRIHAAHIFILLPSPKYFAHGASFFTAFKSILDTLQEIKVSPPIFTERRFAQKLEDKLIVALGHLLLLSKELHQYNQLETTLSQFLMDNTSTILEFILKYLQEILHIEGGALSFDPGVVNLDRRVYTVTELLSDNPLILHNIKEVQDIASLIIHFIKDIEGITISFGIVDQLEHISYANTKDIHLLEILQIKEQPTGFKQTFT